MTDDELADLVWGLLEKLGHADGLGGMEYQRVMERDGRRGEFAQAGRDFIAKYREMEAM